MDLLRPRLSPPASSWRGFRLLPLCRVRDMRGSSRWRDSRFRRNRRRRRSRWSRSRRIRSRTLHMRRNRRGKRRVGVTTILGSSRAGGCGERRRQVFWDLFAGVGVATATPASGFGWFRFDLFALDVGSRGSSSSRMHELDSWDVCPAGCHHAGLFVLRRHFFHAEGGR